MWVCITNLCSHIKIVPIIMRSYLLWFVLLHYDKLSSMVRIPIIMRNSHTMVRILTNIRSSLISFLVRDTCPIHTISQL